MYALHLQVFPEVADELRVSGPGWSECAQGRLAVKPKKGDAVLFYRWAAAERDGTERWAACCRA